jgi:starch synthase
MYPDRVWVQIGFDEALARQIYSALDIFLMPSRYEPCGLSQLYALRYGSIPIVHATGGLVDTVRDATPSSLEQGTATGFHFRPFEPAKIVDALARAREAFRAPEIWSRLVDRAMSEDWSWDKSAVRYEEIYERAITDVRAISN